MTMIDAARDELRQHVLESRRLIKLGDVAGADAETVAAETIIGGWESEGRLVELLSPLLSAAERRAVRFGAASYLLSRGEADLAVPALETIDRERKGLEAADARLMLKQWRTEHTQADG